MDTDQAFNLEGDLEPVLDRLPPRLRAIARLVPPGLTVADIGTDHGLLPAALVSGGHSPRAVATDFSPGPLSVARERFRAAGLDGRVETRIGDGLSPISAGEAGAIVIAGMGGVTIAGILDRGFEAARGAERLILQPMNASGRLRAWLLGHGFSLIDEDLVQDGSRLYVIIAAEPDHAPDSPPDRAPDHLPESPGGAAAGQDQFLIDLGPILFQKRHPLFPDLIREDLAGLRRIESRLRLARRPEAGKMRDIKERISRMEGLLACWPK